MKMSEWPLLWNARTPLVHIEKDEGRGKYQQEQDVATKSLTPEDQGELLGSELISKLLDILLRLVNQGFGIKVFHPSKDDAHYKIHVWRDSAFPETLEQLSLKEAILNSSNYFLHVDGHTYSIASIEEIEDKCIEICCTPLALVQMWPGGEVLSCGFRDLLWNISNLQGDVK